MFFENISAIKLDKNNYTNEYKCADELKIKESEWCELKYNDKFYEDNCDDFYEKCVDNIKNKECIKDFNYIFYKIFAYVKKNNEMNEFLCKKYAKLIILTIKLNDIDKCNLLFLRWYELNMKVGLYCNYPINFSKYIYKAAQYSNILMFNNMLRLCDEEIMHLFKNDQNLNIKMLLQYANKNLSNDTREYIKFIFAKESVDQDCDNFYSSESIENLIFNDLTQKIIDKIKFKHRVYKNNIILLEHQKQKDQLEYYFNNFGYLKYTNKDITEIIKKYMINHDIEYHYQLSYFEEKEISSCDEFLINFKRKIQKYKTEEVRGISYREIQYENLDIIMPTLRDVCSFCYIKHLDYILNTNDPCFIGKLK